jgi:hypothetical protein
MHTYGRVRTCDCACFACFVCLRVRAANANSWKCISSSHSLTYLKHTSGIDLTLDPCPGGSSSLSLIHLLTSARREGQGVCLFSLNVFIAGKERLSICAYPVETIAVVLPCRPLVHPSIQTRNRWVNSKENTSSLWNYSRIRIGNTHDI